MGAAGDRFSVESDSTVKYHRVGKLRKVGRLIRRSGGFRTIQLNFVGWSVLLTPGIVVGLLVALLLNSQLLVGAAIGVSGAWVIAFFVDAVRWRNSPITISCAETPVEVLEQLVSELAAEGLEVRLERNNHLSGELMRDAWMIRSRMKYHNAIMRRLPVI